jgi:hypothetical protein
LILFQVVSGVDVDVGPRLPGQHDAEAMMGARRRSVVAGEAFRDDERVPVVGMGVGALEATRSRSVEPRRGEGTAAAARLREGDNGGDYQGDGQRLPSLPKEPGDESGEKREQGQPCPGPKEAPHLGIRPDRPDLRRIRLFGHW